MSVIMVAGSWLLFTATALVVACVVYYHHSTGGQWRRTEVGRHLMVFMISHAAVLSVSVARTVAGVALDTPWFQVLRLVVFGSVPIVYAWRLRIMWLAQRRRD